MKFGSKVFDYKILEEICGLEKVNEELSIIKTILYDDSIHEDNTYKFNIKLDKPVNIELPGFYYNTMDEFEIDISYLRKRLIINYDGSIVDTFMIYDWVEILNYSYKDSFVILYNINKDFEYFSNVLIISKNRASFYL